MKKVNFCASIDSNQDAFLKELKTSLGATNEQVLQMLVEFYKAPFKSGLDTRQNAELAIKEQLLGNKKINTYTLQTHFEKTQGKRVKPQIINEVLDLYKEEIEAHNAKF